MQEQSADQQVNRPIMTADERKALGEKIASLTVRGLNTDTDVELRSMVDKFDQATADLNAKRAEEGLAAIEATDYGSKPIISEGGLVLTASEAATPVSADEAAEKARDARDFTGRVR